MTKSFATPVACKQPIGYQKNQQQVLAQETSEQRVLRLYDADGGPLIGWLHDECNRRGHTQREMADELGVTYSYIYQLRTGARQTEHISPEVAKTCARYLGVPPIVVKLLAGAVPMSDFVWPSQSEEAVIDRALDSMKVDAIARMLLPANVKALPLAAKRSLVLMYSESSRQDVLGVRHLPEVLQWLQRAVVIHDDNAARAMA